MLQEIKLHPLDQVAL